MFGLGFPELILILVIALIIFGPGKLPEVGKAIGKSVREFKKATNDIKKEFEIDEPSTTHTPQTQPTENIETQKENASIPKENALKNPYTTVYDEKKEVEEKTKESV